jgi:uncharacterized protein YbjT (DUF2867 family)
MIVVTGATGNVGRPLVRALAAAGESVTAVSRRISGPDVPAGVRHRQADLAEPGSLPSVFAGAEVLFLLTSGDFLSAGGRVEDVVHAARAAGIRRIVLLSSQGVATGSHPSTLEDAVTESDLEWTLLRPAGFHSNTLGWAEMVRSKRMIAAPFGDVALPGVDPADIAEVAATVSRAAGHAGKAYVLTGPAWANRCISSSRAGPRLGRRCCSSCPSRSWRTPWTSWARPNRPSKRSARTSNRSSVTRPGPSPTGPSATPPPSNRPRPCYACR